MKTIAAAPADQLARWRRHWIQWLGYKFRRGDEYDEFVELLAPDYNRWAEGVLGRAKMFWPCLEPTKHYFDAAIRAASLGQLLELLVVRYLFEHPVPDGVTLAERATWCQPCQLMPTQRLVSRVSRSL